VGYDVFGLQPVDLKLSLDSWCRSGRRGPNISAPSLKDYGHSHLSTKSIRVPQTDDRLEKVGLINSNVRPSTNTLSQGLPSDPLSSWDALGSVDRVRNGPRFSWRRDRQRISRHRRRGNRVTWLVEWGVFNQW